MRETEIDGNWLMDNVLIDKLLSWIQGERCPKGWWTRLACQHLNFYRCCGHRWWMWWLWLINYHPPLSSLCCINVAFNWFSFIDLMPRVATKVFWKLSRESSDYVHPAAKQLLDNCSRRCNEEMHMQASNVVKCIHVMMWMIIYSFSYISSTIIYHHDDNHMCNAMKWVDNSQRTAMLLGVNRKCKQMHVSVMFHVCSTIFIFALLRLAAGDGWTLLDTIFDQADYKYFCKQQHSWR